MTYEIVTDKDRFPLGSIKGWGDAKDWLDRAKPGPSTSMFLATQGTSAGPALRAEIEAALAKEKSPLPDVKKTLLDLVASLDGAKRAFVTDGVE